MARDNTGLLVLGGLVALLLLGRRQGDGGQEGAVKVSGSVSGVSVAQNRARMGSHRLLKAPGDIATIAATYSVAAFKDGDETKPVNWPYKFFMQVTHNNDVLRSEWTDPFTVPPLNNQTWGFSYMVGNNVLDGWLLNVTVQLYGAVSDPQGNPTNSFSILGNKVHLDAIQIVAPTETVVTGAIGTVNVSQRASGFSVQGGIFAPPPFRPPRSRPIQAPPPFSRRGASFGNTRMDPVKDNPWLERRIAPI